MDILIQERDLAAGTGLVLAPHADDEMIGCGGWLILTRDQPVHRSVIFCAKCDQRRRAEAREALANLHLDHVIELNLPRGGFGDRNAAYTLAEELRGFLETLCPLYIFVPSFGDPHPDHHGTHMLLSAALSGLGVTAVSSTVLLYEGLVPLGDANWWLDISSVFGEKQRRLRAYRSQNDRYGLVEIVSHLNTYRGRTLFRRGITQAEAYKRMSTEEYMSCTASLVS